MGVRENKVEKYLDKKVTDIGGLTPASGSALVVMV